MYVRTQTKNPTWPTIKASNTDYMYPKSTPMIHMHANTYMYKYIYIYVRFT